MSIRPTHSSRGGCRGAAVALCALTVLVLTVGVAAPVAADKAATVLRDAGYNGGIPDPVTTTLNLRAGMSPEQAVARTPNTDQSAFDGPIDPDQQGNVFGPVVWEDAFSGEVLSMTGEKINHVASPNDDMRVTLEAMLDAAQAGDGPALKAASQEMMDILLGTTDGRIYDGFSMLNFNRWKAGIGPEHFAPTAVPGEYKMKIVTDTGDRFINPLDGQEHKVWETDVNMLYYDGQIDSDTFLLHFPLAVDGLDTVRIHYRIFSLVEEDFAPTLVMLDRRFKPDTVNFPFNGFDAVWIAFFPGQVLNVTVQLPPTRMIRGVYTWGWRDHPPRIQFLQPTYEIINQHTGQVAYDPQSESFITRNREDLTIDTIAPEAPEYKMYTVAKAALEGTDPFTIAEWLLRDDMGPRGTWVDWADLAKNQKQLPPEVRDRLAEEGLPPGTFGDYNMISVFMNNEMYGEGPFDNEIKSWVQGEHFRVKLVNLDRHTHYFRNVDFGARLHDDILKCCGGGETSFEIMNFKPSYGAPKVAEMQWRAGWGFRPHHDVIQQPQVFSRGGDRVRLKPYTGGEGETFFGYQYSEAFRGGDFRFSPPPFIIDSVEHPSSFPLKDADGQPGLVVGQRTEGYGVAQFCPEDPYPGFCTKDIQQYNPHGALNWPPPPARAPGEVATELRFPPFLRNPCQGEAPCGDIIPPTAAWRPFLWLNPNNGTIYMDPNDHSKGYWADLTFSHGATVKSGHELNATIELPRAAGQVFYQFDDLFHDNDIFSPHPLFLGFGGDDEKDSVVNVRASVRDGALRVRGQLTELTTGEVAGYVSVFIGGTDAYGCAGQLVGVVPVNRSNGRFVFRKADAGLAPGADLCLQSTIGGVAQAVLGQ